MNNKKLLFCFFIFIFSYLNFQYNLFNVVSDFRFNHFQVESEQFVLDGYLNYLSNKDKLLLGHFTRPSIDMFENGEEYNPREWYNNNFIEGDFWEYKSNYGLQLKIFNLFKGNLLLVQNISSLILSLVLMFIFILMSKIHSLKFSLIFILCIILNPWITPIARNSYFFIFSYFLPFLITLYYSDKIERINKNVIIMLTLLFLVFLFKSLLGYDYISVIVILSMLPIAHYYLKNNLSKIKLLRHFFLISLVSVFSFTIALLMHFNSLNDEEDPLKWIYLTAQKRLSSSNPEQTAYDTCYELWADDNGKFDVDNQRNKDCIDEIRGSLSKNNIELLGRVMVSRHLIPFLGSNELHLTENQEKYLKSIYYNQDISNYEKGKEVFVFWNINKEEFRITEIFSVFINFILSPILFILLIVSFFAKIFKMKSNERIFSILIFAPPFSCFFILKGFSYVTIYSMTYFIWFIPTIPYIISILFSEESILQKDLMEKI